MRHTHHHTQEADSRFWDGIGLALSSLCAIHCLALPLGALALVPLVNQLPDEHQFHWGMALAIFPIGIVAFWRGYQRHHNKSVMILGILGLALIWVGLISGSGEFAHDEFPITLIGSVALILAHYKNWMLSRCKVCKSPSGSAHQGEPAHS